LTISGEKVNSEFRIQNSEFRIQESGVRSQEHYGSRRENVLARIGASRLAIAEKSEALCGKVDYIQHFIDMFQK
jgi:hypothetical protein